MFLFIFTIRFKQDLNENHIGEKMYKTDIYTERLYVLISKEQKEKLQKIADEKLMKISDLIREMIDEYVENYESKSE